MVRHVAALQPAHALAYSRRADLPGRVPTGLFGALFLLAPVALASIRYPEGRRTLVAFAVFALPYPMNIGSRFLIPAVPFLAFAMALALSQWPAILTVVALLHAVSSWPGALERYCGQYAWRLRRNPVRAALRIEPEDHFLARKRDDYTMTRVIEQYVPPGQRVWTPSGLAKANTSRVIMISFQSSPAQTLTDMFSIVNDPALQPTRTVRLAAASFRTRRIRVEQTENSLRTSSGASPSCASSTGDRKWPAAPSGGSRHVQTPGRSGRLLTTIPSRGGGRSRLPPRACSRSRFR